MVLINRIYTRTGDAGTTRLASGAEVSKSDLRVAAYGDVDEANACLGLARLHTTGTDLDPLLARLAAAGVPSTMSRSGRRALFCRDPDGNALEFIESR